MQNKAKYRRNAVIYSWVALCLYSTQVVAVTVTEFYNSNLIHFFITADSSEAAAIDNGSAGPGWVRTGNTFLSGGNTPVCRFYGSQSPGPNSHFFTVDVAECEGLKQLQASTSPTQKRWNFESLDFYSTPPTNGTCLEGTVPVYRAYNNGFSRGIDSNHRITSSLTAIQEVVNGGWSNEGVVMCAPAISLITPYVNSSDIVSVTPFSLGSNSPWGWPHNGIDFMPIANAMPFRAPASGVVEDVILWSLPNPNLNNLSLWQVNVIIKHDDIYIYAYAFETFSPKQVDGQTQLDMITVSKGQTVVQGDIIGYSYVADPAIQVTVHFSLLKNGLGICPENYFSSEAKSSILNLIHKNQPTWTFCF